MLPDAKLGRALFERPPPGFGLAGVVALDVRDGLTGQIADAPIGIGTFDRLKIAQRFHVFGAGELLNSGLASFRLGAVQRIDQSTVYHGSRVSEGLSTSNSNLIFAVSQLSAGIDCVYNVGKLLCVRTCYVSTA